MKFLSPNGHAIVGTAETILATARISDVDPETGEPDYEGGTDVHWDTQETLSGTDISCSSVKRVMNGRLTSFSPMRRPKSLKARLCRRN